MAKKKTAGGNAMTMNWNRNAEARSLASKSATPARVKGAPGSTAGGAGNAKTPPKKKM